MVFKRKNKLLLIPALALLILALTLSSCANPSSGIPPVISVPASQLTGTVTESGSTTVQPLAEKFAAAFMKVNPKVTVTIQGGGTAVGITSANDGTTDIGAASRELTASDPALQKFILARDGIAIIVSPQNLLTGLTKAQVRDIFSGKITNWKDLGGADKTINVVSREEGSGTRTAFQELVMGNDASGKPVNIINGAIFQSSNGALKQVVMGDTNSIGYLSLGYIDNTVKALTIDGVACTMENSKSGVYPIVRPLYFVTKNAPTGVVKAFIDYCQSADAQKIVTDEGYVSVK